MRKTINKEYWALADYHEESFLNKNNDRCFSPIAQDIAVFSSSESALKFEEVRSKSLVNEKMHPVKIIIIVEVSRYE